MIRWIGTNLGTAPATSPELDTDVSVLDVRDLVDKFGNSPDAVREKIETGARLLNEGLRVVVCCDYGISRSNAVAAGILARARSISLSDAVREVSAAIGESEIKLEPLLAVRQALTKATDISRTAGHTLVTGGTGFIAGHLNAVKANIPNLVMFSSRDGDLTAGAMHLDLAVRDHGVDQILHLANPRVYTSNRAMGDTLSILRNVLDVCRSTGARLVYLSSWEVYSGYRSANLIASETLPALPKGPYGETKLLCERLIEHHRTHHALDCTIIRSSPVFGGGSDKPKFIYNFIRQALSGATTLRTHRYRNGPPSLDLMHVSDLVALISKVLKQRPSGDFNVGGGHLLSTADIAQMVVDVVGSLAVVENVDVGDDVANIEMDSARARALLDWQPSREFAKELPNLIDTCR